MAINFYNSVEGGIHGTAVTTGNSGGASGSAFTTVNPGTGGAITFSSSYANSGFYSYNLTAGSGSACFLRTSAAAAMVSARAYFYFTGWPSTATQIINVTNSTGLMGDMGVAASGIFLSQDAAGTINNGPAVAVGLLNTWLRFELTVAAGTTTSNGYVRAAVYVGNDVNAPLYIAVSNARNTGTTNSITVSFGKVSNAGTWPTMYMDDIAIADSPNVGPANTAPANWLTC